MQESTTDLLMFFQPETGGLIPGESRAVVNLDDQEMVEGFAPGFYFNIEDFNTSLQVEDTEESKTADPTGKAATGGQRGPKRAGAGEFLRWRSATDAELKALLNTNPRPGYKSNIQDYTFTRQLDLASPIFFEACLNSRYFTRAVLIKRRGIGEPGGGGQWMQEAVLRLEFAYVLITALDWDDGDLVSEKCTFSFRKVTMKYRTLGLDGTLGKVQSANWAQPDASGP
jgi:type VI protein secretion system component Hcp